jgi:hypothetical protein
LKANRHYRADSHAILFSYKSKDAIMRSLTHLRTRHSASYLWFGLLALAVSPATFAAEPVAKTDDFGRDLVVDPAAEPVPALRYRLLPPSESLQPGNAAPIYLRLEHERGQEWRKRLAEEPSEYLDMPFEEMPLDRVGKLLEYFDDTLTQISAAGKRADSSWEYVMEKQDPLLIRLADAQHMRTYGRLVSLKARYEIRQGQFDQALATLQEGMAMSQHVARPPLLVNRLIAIAIGDRILERLDEWVQQPGAANLYWALAALPRPLVRIGDAFDMERRLLELKFPELAELDRPRSHDDWRRLAEGLRSWAAEVSKMERIYQAAKVESATTQQIAPERLAQARIYLRDTVKLPAEQVQAMSEAEVEVRYTVALQREIENDYEKWFLLPFAQSLPEAEKRNQALLAEGERRELYPLTSILLPLKANLIASEARGPRRIAIYQVIEALRMQAAERGALPNKLEDVTVVPVPIDPGSGKPFSYTLDADVATIDAPSITGAEHESLRLPVRIKLRSK